MFLFAPLYHPAMKAVGPLRRALGFRTIFNLCGPLTNPAGARAQVIGVLAPSRVLLVGRTLAALGAKRAFVVHGTDGIDELTTTGESVVARIEESETGGEPTLKAARITPEMAGLPRATLDQFIGGDVQTNVALLYDVLTGIPGARRDIVLLNAAAALVAAGLAGDLKEGVAQGAEAIDSGQAAATLAKLRQFRREVCQAAMKTTPPRPSTKYGLRERLTIPPRLSCAHGVQGSEGASHDSAPQFLQYPRYWPPLFQPARNRPVSRS